MGLHSARRVTFPSNRSLASKGFGSCSSGSVNSSLSRWENDDWISVRQCNQSSDQKLVGNQVYWWETRTAKVTFLIKHQLRKWSMAAKYQLFFIWSDNNTRMTNSTVSSVNAAWSPGGSSTKPLPGAYSWENTPRFWWGRPKLNLCSLGTTVWRPRNDRIIQVSAITLYQ